MGARGPAPAPKLQVVREGRQVRPERHDDQLVLPATAPAEPRWAQVFPSVRGRAAAAKRLRATASAEWRRIVPPLAAHRVLTEVDRTLLVDHCTACAELAECVRTVALEGHVILGANGWVRHPASMTAAQLRSSLSKTMVQLGLTPAARARMSVRPDGGDSDGDDDPFD